MRTSTIYVNPEIRTNEHDQAWIRTTARIINTITIHDDTIDSDYTSDTTHTWTRCPDLDNAPVLIEKLAEAPLLELTLGQEDGELDAVVAVHPDFVITWYADWPEDLYNPWAPPPGEEANQC